MKTVRYGVVGLKHGMEHVATVLKRPNARLAALCDISEAALAAGAAAAERTAPGAKPETFTSYETMLERCALDAVVIAVPPHLHDRLAIAAIEAGKHVLLEKPLTNTLAEGDRLVAACRGAKTVVQIGYCVRSSQMVARIMDIIRTGRLGDVVFTWWHMFGDFEGKDQAWRQSRKMGGGKLLDCLCHYMDIMKLFVGAPFVRVTAYGHEKGKVGPNPDKIPQVSAVIFEYENGAKGSVGLSEVSPTPVNSLFGVVGTRGIIHGDPWSPEGAGSLDCYLDGGLYREKIVIDGTIASRGHLGFREQHEAFYRAIVDGAPVPCTVADGYEALLMTTAVDRSVATGRTIFRKDMLKKRGR